MVELRRAWLVPALAALLMAGCGQPAPVPAGIPVDAHGDPLPTVHGVVVDEAIRPLPGVAVRLLGTDLTATTGDDGAYQIRRPTLRAEHVVLSASKPGFVTRAAQVQVSGHVPAKLDFRLDDDPSVLPHVEVLKQSGSLPCSVRLATPAAALGLACPGDLLPTAASTAPPAWTWILDADPGLAGAVVELHWDSATPASGDLRARLAVPLAGGKGGDTVAEDAGGSPLRLEVPEQAARAMPRWTGILVEVDLTGSSASALSLEQGFDAFATLFYVDAAPPGYVLA